MTFDPATTYTEEAIRAATLAASIIATSDGPRLYAQADCVTLRFIPSGSGWRLDPTWRAHAAPPAPRSGSAAG